MKYKRLALLILTLLMLAVTTAACAQTYRFREIYAMVDMDDGYILLTPDNLDMHSEWVASTGFTKEQLIEQWKAEGLLLTAYTREGDVEITIRAVQDEDALQYFDLDQQTDKTRAAWKSQQANGDQVKAEGYTISSAEWKKTNQYGRFLNIKYKQEKDGQVWRGLMRKAIRNGHTITIDYRIKGRSVKNTDVRAMDTIMASFAFSQVIDKPAEAASKAVFTVTPPPESSTGEYTVEGTCDPGLRVLGVAMKMSSSGKVNVETTSDKSGKFVLRFKLPAEGIWLTTLSIENGDTTVQEEVFTTTTYQTSLLPVNFDSDVPSGNVSTPTVTLSGTTIRGVTIQCITGEKDNREVTTNGTGRFSFKVPVTAEGEYNVTLVFSKKNYNTRRYTFTFNKVAGAADNTADVRADAIKPAYPTLVEKLKGYTGRIMKYNLYFVESRQNEDGTWQLKMAMGKTSRGLTNLIIVHADEDPGMTNGQQRMMYGRCTGSGIW